MKEIAQELIEMVTSKKEEAHFSQFRNLVAANQQALEEYGVCLPENCEIAE